MTVDCGNIDRIHRLNRLNLGYKGAQRIANNKSKQTKKNCQFNGRLGRGDRASVESDIDAEIVDYICRLFPWPSSWAVDI